MDPGIAPGAYFIQKNRHTNLLSKWFSQYNERCNFDGFGLCYIWRDTILRHKETNCQNHNYRKENNKERR